MVLNFTFFFGIIVNFHFPHQAWKAFEFWCEGVLFSAIGLFGLISNLASFATFLSADLRTQVMVMMMKSPKSQKKHSRSVVLYCQLYLSLESGVLAVLFILHILLRFLECKKGIREAPLKFMQGAFWLLHPNILT